MAPGVNVLSSVPAFDCDPKVDTGGCFAFFQGTSMATPHLAGSAAVLLSQHSSWTPRDVNSALVNTRTGRPSAPRPVTPTSSTKDGVQIQGGGLENVLAATAATLTLNPVSITFGAVPRNSGESSTQKVTVTSHGTAPVTLNPSITDRQSQSGVTFSVGAPVTIPAGGSATVTVSVANAKSATAGPSPPIPR